MILVKKKKKTTLSNWANIYLGHYGILEWVDYDLPNIYFKNKSEIHPTKSWMNVII